MSVTKFTKLSTVLLDNKKILEVIGNLPRVLYLSRGNEVKGDRISDYSSSTQINAEDPLRTSLMSTVRPTGSGIVLSRKEMR